MCKICIIIIIITTIYKIVHLLIKLIISTIIFLPFLFLESHCSDCSIKYPGHSLIIGGTLFHLILVNRTVTCVQLILALSSPTYTHGLCVRFICFLEQTSS